PESASRPPPVSSTGRSTSPKPPPRRSKTPPLNSASASTPQPRDCAPAGARRISASSSPMPMTPSRLECSPHSKPNLRLSSCARWSRWQATTPSVKRPSSTNASPTTCPESSSSVPTPTPRTSMPAPRPPRGSALCRSTLRSAGTESASWPVTSSKPVAWPLSSCSTTGTEPSASSATTRRPSSPPADSRASNRPSPVAATSAGVPICAKMPMTRPARRTSSPPGSAPAALRARSSPSRPPSPREPSTPAAVSASGRHSWASTTSRPPNSSTSPSSTGTSRPWPPRRSAACGPSTGTVAAAAATGGATISMTTVTIASVRVDARTRQRDKLSSRLTSSLGAAERSRRRGGEDFWSETVDTGGRSANHIHQSDNVVRMIERFTMRHYLKSHRKLALLGASVAIGALALSGCGNQKGQGNAEADSGSSDDGDVTIALLLPESKTTRYESLDKPNFEKYVAEANPDAKVEYRNANQDATQQQQQFEAAVNEGGDAIVLDPVDASAGSSALSKAQAKKIPVISYDRFLEGADYYTSFDNRKIGNLQGQAVLDGLEAEGTDPKSGPVWMVNGDPKDPNAADFKAGAEETLEDAGVDIAASHDTLDWNPDDARQWVEGQLQGDGEKPIAIYAANDGTAGGVIAAAKKAKVDTVITGQDAEVDGLQNILK